MKQKLSEHSKYRVVIADDNAVLRKIVTRALDQTRCFRVVGEAGDGDEAVTVVAAEQPDILILDMSMPLRGGLESLPDLRAASPDTFITVFSGIHPEVLSPAATEAGAHLYLDKGSPMNDFVTELLAAVAEFEASRLVEALTLP